MLTFTALEPESFPPLFRIRLTDNTTKHPAGESGPSPNEELDKSIICSACSGGITTQKHKIHVNGSHEHTFFNPAGIAFEIQCFHLAPGCIVQGQPSSDFSWFEGFRWQYATCSNCLTYIGWFFVKSETSFFALIINKLLEG